MYPIYRTAADPRLTNVVVWEHEYQVSRAAVTVLAGNGADRVLKLGQVLGQRTKGAPVITPAGGNTGDGALGALTLGATALLGDYTAVCTAAAANAGTFAVIDPAGRRLADAMVGVAYVSPDLAFTISDGAADWIVGDTITVTVPEGDGKVVEIDFTATDGTQDAYGVLSAPVTAPDGEDADGLAIVREAVLVDGGLIWPAGAPADQKAAALEQLEQARIYTRQEA